MEQDEDLEQTLLKVRRLIETTVSKHRDQSSERGLVAEVKVDDEAISQTAAEMIQGAERSIEVVLAAAGEPARTVRRVLPEVLGDGPQALTARVLSTQAFIDAGGLDPLVPTVGDRCQLRIGRVPALSLIIVDGSTALTCSESAHGRRASVIVASLVVRTLTALFDGVWRNAAAAAERVDFVGRVRSDTTRQVLAKLQAGVTDEAASRDLRVSVRTYRRYVAEIMTLLGASSRFQAGVRAAELGLLHVPPPTGGLAAPKSVNPGRGRAAAGLVPGQRRRSDDASSTRR